MNDAVLRDRAMNRDRLIVAGIALVLLVSGLGAREPWPADEPRFALIAREMVETGDWMIPHRAGEIYSDKPPLFFWTVAFFYLVTGSLRLAFRLPAVISGVVVILLVHDLAARLWNRRAALYSAFALLLSFQFLMEERRGRIDGFLLLWTTLALYGICRHLLAGPARGWWYVGFAAAGAGIITKGVGFLPLLVLIPASLMKDVRRCITKSDVAGGFSLLFAVVLAWLLPMLLVVSMSGNAAYEAYRDQILFKQTAGRYLNAWHHHHWFGYLIAQVLPWAWAPLTLLTPWTVPALWRRLRRGDPRMILLVSWIALALLFFSVTSGKRGVYILPILPAFVLAHTPLIAGLLQKAAVKRMMVAMGCLIAAGSLAVSFLPAIDAARMIQSLELPSTGLERLAAAGAAIALVAAASTIAFRKRPQLALLISAAAICFVLGWIVEPAADGDRSGAAFMHQVEQRLPRGNQLGILEWHEKFALQASVPVKTFGYGRRDYQDEVTDAASWLNSDASHRWVLYNRHHADCFDVRRSVSVGRAVRMDWFLARRNAIQPQCADHRHIAVKAPAF